MIIINPRRTCAARGSSIFFNFPYTRTPVLTSRARVMVPPVFDSVHFNTACARTSVLFIMNVFAPTEGVVIPRMSPEQWQALKSFPLQQDDVIISSYPRSGSTWTQHTVRLLRNGGKDDGINLDDAVPWLEVLGTPKGNMMNLNPQAVEQLVPPRSMKTHLPYHMTPGGLPHTTGTKYIYIIRNPKDVCVSFWHFGQTQIKKFQSGDDQSGAGPIPWDLFFTDFMEAKNGGSIYGGWLNHVLGWWKHKDAPNILFLRYETVKKEPYKTVQTIAKFMGMKDVTDEYVETVVGNSSFDSMSMNSSVNNRKKDGASFAIQFLRKGIIGDWKNHFTAAQNATFEENFGKIFEENGLLFDYE